jgi:hypothetical protein
MAAEMQAAEAFLGSFLLPLVGGGEVHVREPLDARDLAALEDLSLLADDALAAVEAARQRRAEDLWPEPLDTRLDGGALRLAVAAHNLLYLSHPANEHWTVTHRGLQRVALFTERCLLLPLPDSPADLVLRETVVGNLRWLKRTDVDVSYWAGSRTFRGQQPPPRLLAWPRLRRVRRSSTEASWLTADLPPGQLELVGLLLRQSPLTDLLYPWRPAPPFDWLQVLPCLKWSGIARLVCHEYLRLGLERVEPYLAQAFWRLLPVEDQALRRHAVMMVAGLVSYLLAATAMAAPPDAPAPGEVAREAPDPEPQGSVGFSLPRDTLGAVLVAAAGCGLFPDRQALGDGPVAERLDRWLADYRTRTGEAGSTLAASLQLALDRR